MKLPGIEGSSKELPMGGERSKRETMKENEEAGTNHMEIDLHG